ncbi:MAG: prepilin peptidase [Desulfitobacteriaceae bacterium]|nr:prepilin peptidase [Desulfitobacteriaceae bacterium]
MQELVVALVLLVCVITDYREHKIYNMVLLPSLLLGVGYNFVIAGWLGLGQSALGMLAGLTILLIPFALGGMGAGDVKLLAVIGAVKGPVFVFYSALGMGLAGGIMALGIIAYKGGLFRKPASFFHSIWLMLTSGFKVNTFDLGKEKIMLPYGLAIAAGAVGAYWWMG